MGRLLLVAATESVIGDTPTKPVPRRIYIYIIPRTPRLSTNPLKPGISTHSSHLLLALFSCLSQRVRLEATRIARSSSRRYIETDRLPGCHQQPPISEEAKEHSRQVIEELERQPETEETRHETHVNAGYKVTLKSRFYYS